MLLLLLMMNVCMACVQVGWDTGRPRRSHCEPATKEKMDAVRAGDDNKFLKVKKKLLDTGMPVLYRDLRVCNGLDVQVAIQILSALSIDFHE